MGVDDSKGPGMSMSPQITAKDVEDYVSRFEWFRNPDRQGYWAAAKDRLVTTLNLIPRLPNPEQVRVLEIGGMPYFMTALIEHLFGYTVEVINEPTWERGEDGNVEILESDDGDRHEIHYKTLNIEYDRWPWEDGRFDIVLYCEVIEHLVYDPTRTLVEAHRVLKKDTGKLLISTPNALAYPYLLQMIQGVNFYPPYSGYSHYARHHRLYSPEELVKLCSMVGYQVHTCYSVYDHAYAHPRWLEPAVLRQWSFAFFAHLSMPGTQAGQVGITGGSTYFCLTDPHSGAWARVTVNTADERHVTQGGDRRLWDELEAAHELWERLEQPRPEDFTISISTEGEQVVRLPGTERVWGLSV